MTRVFKIVRDKIPKMVDEATERRHPHFTKLSGFQHEVRSDLWLQKLQEELDELKEAWAKYYSSQGKDSDGIVEESADLLEVFWAMIADVKMPIGYISQQQLDKTAKRGSFDKGIVMEYDE